MTGFEPGQIVRVPFPYTDRPVRQRRPALVVSAGELGERTGLLWVVMITSAENRAWSTDVALISDYQEAGIPAPSLIRPAKIATIESREADVIGRLPAEKLRAVQEVIQIILRGRRTIVS